MNLFFPVYRSVISQFCINPILTWSVFYEILLPNCTLRQFGCLFHSLQAFKSFLSEPYLSAKFNGPSKIVILPSPCVITTGGFRLLPFGPAHHLVNFQPDPLSASFRIGQVLLFYCSKPF